MINNPLHTANTPNKTLAQTYTKDCKDSPLNAKLKVSKEKVEKVVKPPQNPTIKREFSFGDIIPFLFNHPDNNPKIKHPKIFIVKVAKGNGVFHITRKRRLTKNRQQVPMKPPAPAISINLHILISIRQSKLQKKADLEPAILNLN